MKEIILAALWVVVTPAMAQRHIDKTISFLGKQSVEMNVEIADSISIETWTRPEVQITASINLNNNEDNDAYETSFLEEGSNVIIKANIKKDHFHDNNCCCKGLITWKIIIPENTPFHIETINGNITIKGNTANINAKSISGFIEWQLTSDSNASLEMKTLMGTIYTNLELESEKSEFQSPEYVSKDLNGGGIPVKLETITGNIYCRRLN